MSRETRHWQQQGREDGPRDDGRAAPHDTTTYYLVPQGGEAKQKAPAKPPLKQHPRENLVELKTRPVVQYTASHRSADSLPGRDTSINLIRLASFVLCVVLPTLMAFVYFLLIASPQYVSEFRFSVKDNSAPQHMGMPSMLPGTGAPVMGSVVENFLVVDYLTSRQAVDDLQKMVPLIDFYARSDVDSWSRFDRSQPVEDFVAYWRKMVRANYDQITGIASAQVRAFTPQDSQAVANALVVLSEELVNRIANRTRIDAVKFAESEVEKAQERVRRVRAQLVERTAGNAQQVSPQVGANAALLLDLERQTSQNLLAGAMQALDQARANAVTQHLYITPYVRPSLPQSATYPRPYLWTLLVAAGAFAIWLIGLLTLRAIFDH